MVADRNRDPARIHHVAPNPRLLLFSDCIPLLATVAKDSVGKEIDDEEGVDHEDPETIHDNHPKESDTEEGSDLVESFANDNDLGTYHKDL